MSDRKKHLPTHLENYDFIGALEEWRKESPEDRVWSIESYGRGSFSCRMDWEVGDNTGHIRQIYLTVEEAVWLCLEILKAYK